MYWTFLGIAFAISFVAILGLSSFTALVSKAIKKTRIQWSFIFGISATAAMLAAIGLVLRYPPDPHANCHRALMGAIDEWMLENKTNVYPNINGDEAASFASINQYFRVEDATLYGYVPGLTLEDPKELVMIYLKKMTRKTWNGDHSASISSKKKWFIGGPDYWWNPDVEFGLPEGGQIVDTPEFKRRLRKTLEFLEKNNRPYWTNVVAEHSRFLETIKD